MKTKRVLAGLGVTAATTLLLAACSGTSAPAPSGKSGGNAEAGKAVFATNCNVCHPNGGAAVGPALKGKEADAIKKQVRNGGAQMPPFPASKISDQQLEDIIAYIKTLK